MIVIGSLRNAKHNCLSIIKPLYYFLDKFSLDRVFQMESSFILFSTAFARAIRKYSTQRLILRRNIALHNLVYIDWSSAWYWRNWRDGPSIQSSFKESELINLLHEATV